MGKISKTIKKDGKASFDGPKTKKRKAFAPSSKAHSPKKGKGAYKRKKKEVVKESNVLCNFVEFLMKEDYAKAHECLKLSLQEKIKERISEEMNKPLF